MARPFKPATAEQVRDVGIALAHLRAARDLLQSSDSPLALERVRLAITSTEGALRHIEGRRQRTLSRA